MIIPLPSLFWFSATSRKVLCYHYCWYHWSIGYHSLFHPFFLFLSRFISDEWPIGPYLLFCYFVSQPFVEEYSGIIIADITDQLALTFLFCRCFVSLSNRSSLTSFFVIFFLSHLLTSTLPVPASSQISPIYWPPLTFSSVILFLSHLSKSTLPSLSQVAPTDQTRAKRNHGSINSGMRSSFSGGIDLS